MKHTPRAFFGKRGAYKFYPTDTTDTPDRCYTKRMARIGILLTGGGTGGHIYPLLAVAKKLPGECDIRYFGDPGPYRKLLQTHGIRVSRILSSKLRRYFSWRNFFEPFRFALGLAQALWKLFWFMPAVAFSKGGPGALAIIYACRWYRIPVVVHESDAVPGLTNRITAKRAKIVELAFKEAEPHLGKIKAKVNVAGSPVREELLRPQPSAQAKKSFGFDPAKPLVLVLGGSQGAERINDFIIEHLRAFLDHFQILHQVGIEKYEEYKNEYEFLTQKWAPEIAQRYQFHAYLNENVGDAYDAADAVVSRAGAGALFECAAKGKPAILIPLPEAANNHQIANAYAFAKRGAGIVLEEENLLPAVFLTQVNKILENPELRRDMGAASAAFFIPGAAERIAEDIMSLVQ